MARFRIVKRLPAKTVRLSVNRMDHLRAIRNGYGDSPPSLQELRAARGGPPRRRGRWLKWVWIGGAVLVVVLGLLTWALPPWLRGRAEGELTHRLGRPTTIERLRLNPLTLAITVEGLAISGRNPSMAPCLSWRRLRINLDSWALISGDLGFDAIELDGFHARVERGAGGEFDFADILSRLASDQDASGARGEVSAPVRLAIRRLAVADASIDFSDTGLARPFSASLGPVSFGLERFRTTGDGESPYVFEAVTAAGERVAWRGIVSASPLRSSGELVLAGWDLARLSPYFHHLIEGELRSARLDLSGRYTLEWTEATPILHWLDGAVALRELRVGGPETSEDALDVKQIALTGIQADLIARQVEVAKVDVQGVAVRAVRDRTGVDLVNWLTPQALAANPAHTGDDPDSRSGPVPRIRVREILVRDASSIIADLTVPRRAEFSVLTAKAVLRELDTAELARPLPVEVDLELAEEGRVSVAGTVAVSPLVVDVLLDVERLGLSSLSPYVETLAKVHLIDGSASVSGRVKYSDGGDLHFEGDGGVARLRLVELADEREVLSWSAFALSKVTFDSRPLTLRVGEAQLSDATLALWLGLDGRLGVAPNVAGSASESATSVASAAPPRVAIDRVVVNRTALRFEDRGVQPPAQMALTDLDGVVTGLDSDAPARATVDLQGRVDETAPVMLTGTMNPLATVPYADLKFDVKGLDLIAGAGPYVAKYVGRRLERGGLGLAVRTRVMEGRVDSDHVVTLDRFDLGARTDSPDATSLPVGLALALLRDPQGRIVIDIPVRGRLDDPEFKVGRVVLRVVTNLLAKAATSPFSLLGAAFGGGGDELGWQVFAPGATEPEAAEAGKLATVARALRERPALRLDLVPQFDAVADRLALAAARLDRQVRLEAWQVRRQVDANAPAPEAIEITPELRAGMIARLHAAAFAREVNLGVATATTGTSAQPIVPNATSQANPAETDTAERGLNTGRLPRYNRRESLTWASSIPRPVAEPASVPLSSAGEVVLPPMASGAADPILDTAQMEEQLLAREGVPEAELAALAQARAEGIRRRLLAAGGITMDRVGLTPARSGGARVELQLR